MIRLYVPYFLLASAILFAEPLDVDLKSQGAILFNPENGAILYEKNARDPFYPASITKIATAAYILSLHENDLDQVVTADQESLATITLTAKKKARFTLPSYWLETDGVHIGIKVGEQLRLRDLLAGMLISSGNDAANVATLSCMEDLGQYSKRVNAYLKKIGCKNTHFVNPHGLHHPDHVTTAYDMAILTKEALKYPYFRETVSKTYFIRPKTNKQPEVKLSQTNRLLKQGSLYYAPAIGVKTGYTSAAQSTFVAAARENDRTLIAVMLKCKEREELFKDAIKLFKAAFAEKQRTKIFLDAGPLAFSLPINGVDNPLELYTVEPLAITSYPAEEPEVRPVLTWEPLTLPIKAAQKVGTMALVDSTGKIHSEVDLLSQTTLSYTWLGWLKHMF